MAYWSPSALNALAQSESGGNASLVHYPNNVAWGGSSTSGSSATGLYGFTTGTWRTYAQQSGVDINQYPYAYTAPANVQTQVALNTPISNWTCSGCNYTASSLALNPGNVSVSPVSSDNYSNFTPGANTPDYFGTSVTPGSREQYPIADGTSAVGDPSTAADAPYGDLTDIPSGLQPEGYYGGALHVNVTGQTGTGATTSGTPSGSVTNSGVLGGGTNPQGVAAQSGTGTPIQVNLSPQTATDLQSYFTAPIKAAENAITAYLSSISNWFVRAGLILLAIVIVFIALWRLSGGTNQQLVTAVKGAAA